MPLCKNCNTNEASTNIGLCGPCDMRVFSYSSKATVQGAGKLLGITTATLKRLEATGELVPTRNSYGSRLYTREAIEKYLATKGRLVKRAVSSPYSGIPATDLQAIQDEFSGSATCSICNTNPRYHGEYCLSCYKDLISIDTAASLYGIKPHQLQALIDNSQNFINVYAYGAQKRLRHSELDDFFSLHHGVAGALQTKWSSHFKVCRNCKTSTHAYYGSGYCSECYPSSTQAAAYQKYKSGLTLQQVGNTLGITRERVRQLIEKVEDDIRTYQGGGQRADTIMRPRGRTAESEEVSSEALQKAMDLHGRQCYSCQKTLAKAPGGLTVYYADGDESNDDEQNIYPICKDCLSLVRS